MRVKIWPRQSADRDGYVCMPLFSNVPVGKKGWKLTRCLECGRLCWKMPGIADLEAKQGAKALCTSCALTKGAQEG